MEGGPENDPCATGNGAEKGPREAETVEVQIESLTTSGDGVGRDERGRAVFVPFTAPGDRVRVRVVRAKARWARGRVEELITPGPTRTDPLCAVFGSCGGCSWQHVRYDAQVAAKREIVHDALTRLGHLSVPEPIEMVPCPEEYGYRIRTRVRVERGRAGYRRRRSHALCATRRCPVLAPALDRALEGLPDRARGRHGDWWLAVGDDEKVHSAPVGLASRRAEPLHRRVGRHDLRASLAVFSQSNGPLFQQVAHDVIESAGTGRTALELFAGAGYLTLGLADRFERVIAVESDWRAARDLERNRAQVDGGRIELVTSGVEEALSQPPVVASRPEVVVLDPPRTGLPRDTVAPLAELGAGRIVYLSCDPATLARDLALLAQHGYALDAVKAFDLFPQTPHVEVLAQLVAMDVTSGSGAG